MIKVSPQSPQEFSFSAAIATAGATPRAGADQARSDHARMGQLLQTCRGEVDLQQVGCLRLVATGPYAAGPPRLELGSAPPPSGHARRAVADRGGRGRVLPDARRDRFSFRLPGATRSQRHGHPRTPPDGRDRGEPVAERSARRVRRAARGNGPVATPTPRPGPTQQGDVRLRRLVGSVEDLPKRRIRQRPDRAPQRPPQSGSIAGRDCSASAR
jgi:hypothetical protein